MLVTKYECNIVEDYNDLNADSFPLCLNATYLLKLYRWSWINDDPIDKVFRTFAYLILLL